MTHKHLIRAVAGAGLFHLAGVELLERLRIGGVGLLLLAGLVADPGPPAVDRGDAQGQSAEDAQGVLAQPGANAFALFVFVQQVVDCHAVPCPAQRSAGSVCCCGMPPVPA